MKNQRNTPTGEMTGTQTLSSVTRYFLRINCSTRILSLLLLLLLLPSSLRKTYSSVLNEAVMGTATAGWAYTPVDTEVTLKAEGLY